MDNVKSSTANNLQAAHDLEQLIENGRKLHSEAVYRGIMKLFSFPKHNMDRAVPLKEQRKLKYSH